MKYIHELAADAGIEASEPAMTCPVKLGQKNRINILALGDVGTTMLTGLRLLGADVISEIGIMDIRRDNLERLEMEINQIGYPFGLQELPPVFITDEDRLFDCDVLIFCASRGVPPVVPAAGRGSEGASADGGRKAEDQTDVRMAQLEANREIISHYAALAREAEYKGLAAVVSDPVDNLAAAFLDASGLEPHQIRGYGLGVMNMRALYYSKKMSGSMPALALYETEGRAYGPHGRDLVIANSIEHYDEEASEILTEMAVNANIRIRELGFKPYIAPALSSAAISIILTLRGEWNYGSVYMGSRSEGAFLGIRSRMTENGIVFEDAGLPDRLYDKILRAYKNLCGIR